jgi:glycosyltransferase involved in cell wall biosynthesis
MRITLTAPVLEGGIGQNLVNLAASWRERGIEVDLILDHRREALMPDIPSGMTVIESGGSHALFKAPWLARYLRRRAPAVILTPVPRHTAWALRARRLSRVPVVVAANVHQDYLACGERLRPGKRRRRDAQLSRDYRRCDAVIPVSRGVARSFSRLTGIDEARLTPIPNPVLTPALAARAREPVDHPWFGDGGPPIVIWVGRLEYQKNVDLLIEAFGRLRADTPCRLAIVGTGAEEASLMALARASPQRDSIAFLGHQANPYRFIGRSAVLALCSRWEGFGNVLVEAMALGTAVVSTACPSGPDEILDDGRLGPLVPVGDAAALAAGIRQCLLSPVPPATLIAAAQHYRADLVAGRYLELFSVLARGAAT